MNRRREYPPQKANQLDKAPDIIPSSPTSIKLVDYRLQGNVAKAILGKNEEISVLCTDKGEYITRTYNHSVTKEKLHKVYGGEMSEIEDPFCFPGQKDNETWDALDYIDLYIRENTLFGDNTSISLFRFAIIPLKKGEGDEGTKERRIIRAFQNPTGNFMLYRQKERYLVDHMVWPLRAVTKLLDPEKWKWNGKEAFISRNSPLGIPYRFNIVQRHGRDYLMKDEHRKDTVSSIALELDQSKSKLLPWDNNEKDKGRWVGWTYYCNFEFRLMSVTTGTRANINSEEECRSDND